MGDLVHQSAAAISILLVYTLLVENLIVLIPTVGEKIQKRLPLTAAKHFATAGIPAPVEGQRPALLVLPHGR